jgi:Fe-S oxidoreductase
MMDWEGSFITQLRYQPEIEGPPCLKEWEREMNTCTYCGFCKAVCPIFKELGWDDCAARGKVLLAYGLLKGDLSPSSDLARGFYQCAQCLDCYRRCPSKIKTPQIIESVREYLVERGYFLPHHQILKEKIEQTGNIFGEKDLVSPQQEGEITLFIGCQYLSRLNKTKMYLRMLKQLGIKVKVRKEICCGVPLKTLGWQESFENHQEKFLALFGGEKEVITICPTCSVFLKEEYNLRTHHILKVLLEKLPQLKASHELVTYHDPCDLSRGLKMTTPPREVIKKLGYELVEMEGSKELSHCCGGGGGMLVSSPELVERIAERRIQEAYTTGAKYLITACPTCEQVLKNASQRKASRGEKTIAVVDIRDLLWKTLKPS